MRWLPNLVTPRQFEVWRCVSVGMSNAQIGERLHLSRHCVIYDVGQLYDKLLIPEGASKRVRLASMFPEEPLTRGV